MLWYKPCVGEWHWKASECPLWYQGGTGTMPAVVETGRMMGPGTCTGLPSVLTLTNSDRWSLGAFQFRRHEAECRRDVLGGWLAVALAHSG